MKALMSLEGTLDTAAAFPDDGMADAARVDCVPSWQNEDNSNLSPCS